jgi:hypothetical protein
MEEVSTTNKLPWIIAGIVALVILVGITAVMFSGSSNKTTEKAPEDMTISETITSCMQTCKQLPIGSTRTNCESGCSQVQQAVNEEFQEAGISGAADMTTEELLQELIAKCINNCQTDTRIEDQYKPACIENCKKTTL